MEDLLAAGSRLNAPAPPDEKAVGDQAPAAVQRDATDDEAAAPRAELERLRPGHALALADERTARALAEAKARHLKACLEERAGHLEDLQRALAAPTPAPDRAAIPPARTAVAGPSSSPRRPGADGGRGGCARRRLGRVAPLVAGPGPMPYWLRHVARVRVVRVGGVAAFTRSLRCPERGEGRGWARRPGGGVRPDAGVSGPALWRPGRRRCL
ncbi:hypothetical protein WJ438_01770 [Streptomyces sp. GD-15H]|uniref:hypothetical protein n=1 Tax=Streptomyces sp. GD-15H TaxID=3129112 RepID=UPI003249C0E4